MNRAALSICILGVVAAGYSPVVLYANQDGHAPDALAVAVPSAPAEAADVAATGSINPKAETVSVWSPPRASFAAPIDASTFDVSAFSDTKPSALSQAVYADALPSAYEGDYDAPIWAIVTRGAKLHSDPDVSSPTTWFYAVGAKLNVVGYRQGWYRVVDPETSRRGFIYARYYLDALGGPGEAPVVAKAPVLTQTALAEPAAQAAPKPTVRHSSHMNLSLLAPPDAVASAPVTRARQSFAATRPDGVASLLDRALRR